MGYLQDVVVPGQTPTKAAGILAPVKSSYLNSVIMPPAGYIAPVQPTPVDTSANTPMGILKNTITGLPAAAIKSAGMLANLSGIPQQWNAGQEQMNQAQADYRTGKAGSIESGLGVGAGLLTKLFAPTAPLLAPVQKGVEIAGNALANTPLLKQYGKDVSSLPTNDPTVLATDRILQAMQNTSVVAGGVLGGVDSLRGEAPVKLPVKSTGETTPIPVNYKLPGTSDTAVHPVEVKTPYIPPEELPTIQMGPKAISPKETLPTIEEGAPQEVASPILSKAKQVAHDISPLTQEAQKYKSAEEFVKKQTPTYHGSSVSLKKFDNKHGTFFTDDYPDATGYAGDPDNVYEGYLNFKKPLVIDAKGAKWDELDTKWGKSTKEIVGNARKDGYDGVTFKNIVDNVMDTAGMGESTVHYAYKPADAFLNESQLTDFYNKVKGGTSQAPILQKPEKPLTYVPIKEPTVKAGPVLKPTTRTSQTLKTIEGTGTTKVRGLAQNVEANAIEKKLTDTFGDLPEYKTVSMKDQARRAAEYITNNPEDAHAVAMGEKAPPKGVLPESVFVAAENKAISEGNVEVLRNLANSKLSGSATTMGQRIRTLGERDSNSPIAAIQEVRRAREAAIASRGINIAKETVKTVKDIEASIKKSVPSKQTWESFIDQITC